MTESQEEMVRYLHGQAEVCGQLGSPLYGRMLHEAGDDAEHRGIAWELLEPLAGAPGSYGTPLKLMGAAHRLALRGDAPELAAIYPSAGGVLDLDRAWPALAETLERHRETLPPLIELPVQTNEVGRSAALLGGFLTVARETGLPLRLLELGSSAGLNLGWDRYLYEIGGRRWGNADSGVRIELQLEGELPLDTQVVIGSRRGCDQAPLDPASADDRLTLLSYVWPDQRWRFEPLRAALAQAQRAPVVVEQADAAEWIENALVERVPGVATIVFHSLVMFWMDEATRARVRDSIEAAGEGATKRSPLAWLRMEAGGLEADVELTTWPGGKTRTIAHAGYHGRPVKWLG